MAEPRVSATRLKDGAIHVHVAIDPDVVPRLFEDASTPILADLIRFAAADALGKDPFDWLEAAKVGAGFRKLEGDD